MVIAISNLRCNEQIRLSPVRLIDEKGGQRGVVPTDEAMRLAREAGMDLVEVSPQERPPVCKILDYGKHKYLQSKKLKQKHHEQKLKEVRMRPKTDPHDRQIKLQHARDFLAHGDRVQFTMMFKGRERFHQVLGNESFQDIIKALEDVAKVDAPPRMFGKRMTMVLVPAGKTPTKPAKQAAPSGAAKPAPVKPAPAAPDPKIPPAPPEGESAPS
jgi:translation initiation factor IF-3